MDNFQAFVLALLQGLTEFLPISSSAHLILLPNIVDWPDQGLAFDVAVHFGTLTAVVVYFREELSGMAASWLRSLKTGNPDAEARLAWAVLLGTIPLGLFGLLGHNFIETALRSPLVIATTTIVFGLLLWYADVKGPQTRCEYRLNAWRVLVIALAQALALIPGTSRSGATITAGMLVGLDRTSAARFSFLLSVPAILLAAGYESSKLLGNDVAIHWTPIVLGVVVAAVSAYTCIHYFLKLLDRIGMLPFVVYRLILGVVLFWMFS
jgi:undecaprenyl-diphosphatase